MIRLSVLWHVSFLVGVILYSAPFSIEKVDVFCSLHYLHQFVLTIWTAAEVFLDVSLSFSSQAAGITDNTPWGVEKREGIR